MLTDTDIERFLVANAYGEPRTIVIKRNVHGRFTWRLLYQDNPALADTEFTYTYNWFDSAAAARRSARRFAKRLGQ